MPNNSQVRAAVEFNNQGFRTGREYARYLCSFRNRSIQPSFTIQPAAFNKYGMDLPSMLAGLGWGSLLEDQRFSFCPEAVRMFYVSMKRGPGPEPSFFTTVVYNHKIKVTPDLLASVLSLPHTGLRAGFDGEFHELGFDFMTSLSLLTEDTGRYFPNHLDAGRLPDDLKVFHWFLTRCWLPRDLRSSALLHPTDLWIMSHARARQPLSFATLVFCHMLRFGDGGYSGNLPFGPLITRLLYRLQFDLRDKVTICNIHEDLRPNHILNRLDADVGRRKLVTGSGGGAGEFPAPLGDSLALVPALLKAAVSAINTEVVRLKEAEPSQDGLTRASLGLMLCKERLELMQSPQGEPEDEAVPAPEDFDPMSSDSETDDDISDYDSPPSYPF
ncbi:unnamed protein product [Linum tenue]|uniref:Putative plant transposon protein domain-containing protein n=1 Tax=Linum tenue TaxID=586396 RepID=A0AAV0HB45_9ROSI|nr:unnamed protein product [Linum tenue]